MVLDTLHCVGLLRHGYTLQKHVKSRSISVVTDNTLFVIDNTLFYLLRFSKYALLCLAAPTHIPYCPQQEPPVQASVRATQCSCCFRCFPCFSSCLYTLLSATAILEIAFGWYMGRLGCRAASVLQHTTPAPTLAGPPHLPGLGPIPANLIPKETRQTHTFGCSRAPRPDQEVWLDAWDRGSRA